MPKGKYTLFTKFWTGERVGRSMRTAKKVRKSAFSTVVTSLKLFISSNRIPAWTTKRIQSKTGRSSGIWSVVVKSNMKEKYRGYTTGKRPRKMFPRRTRAAESQRHRSTGLWIREFAKTFKEIGSTAMLTLQFGKKGKKRSERI
jgi:hypothetical protein